MLSFSQGSRIYYLLFTLSETVEYILYTCLFVNSERENPNTSNLIPNDPMLSVTLNINDFYRAIDRASILANDKEKNIIT